MVHCLGFSRYLLTSLAVLVFPLATQAATINFNGNLDNDAQVNYYSFMVGPSASNVILETFSGSEQEFDKTCF